MRPLLGLLRDMRMSEESLPNTHQMLASKRLKIPNNCRYLARDPRLSISGDFWLLHENSDYESPEMLPCFNGAYSQYSPHEPNSRKCRLPLTSLALRTARYREKDGQPPWNDSVSDTQQFCRAHARDQGKRSETLLEHCSKHQNGRRRLC